MPNVGVNHSEVIQLYQKLHSLRKAGAILGISHERVRQILFEEHTETIRRKALPKLCLDCGIKIDRNSKRCRKCYDAWRRSVYQTGKRG